MMHHEDQVSGLHIFRLRLVPQSRECTAPLSLASHCLLQALRIPTDSAIFGLTQNHEYSSRKILLIDLFTICHR